MKVSDMTTWPAKAAVEGFECRIVKSYDRKSGEGAKGPWTKDFYLVEDAEGGSIGVQHWTSPHPAPFREGATLLVKGKVDIYQDKRSIAGRGGDIHEVGASGGSVVPEMNGPAAVSERLSVEDCNALAGRVLADLLAQGWSDEQAMMAHVNTILIGLQNGKLDRETPEVPYDPKAPANGDDAPPPEPPPDYESGSEYGSPDDPGPEDSDIPF